MNVHTPENKGSFPSEHHACVGPNAVLQLVGVLREQEEKNLAERVFAAADLTFLLYRPPKSMIDERIPKRLFDTLWTELPTDRAGHIARESGKRTADYVMATRIPVLVRYIFRITPPWLASLLLLKAIERNAWTFAGSGTCSTRWQPKATISIKNNPLAMHDCLWHIAVFEQMFKSLVSPATTVI
ncbi:MAG: bacteriochlorophyll 4-vinyl reductase, partial [Pseudomonadota bacterium]